MNNPFNTICQVPPMWVTDEELKLHINTEVEQLEDKAVPQSSSGFLD